jgi:6-phosphofructokinase
MSGVRFVDNGERVLYPSTLDYLKRLRANAGDDPPSMETVGPRQQIFFNPSAVACGIVTCGGLCPGLNDVIRAIVLSLRHHYGVRKTYGFRFGFAGLIAGASHEPLAELCLRLERRGHAVIVVAEGAGQDLMAREEGRDASGNIKYGDIGVFLRDAITVHFRERKLPISLKYIDPSYAIRSVPTTAHDSAFCLLLGHNAVHAGMSGRTDMIVSFWNHQFTHVPIALAVSKRQQIDPQGALWSSVLASTRQPWEMS